MTRHIITGDIMNETNKNKNDEKFKDGIISKITENFYVLFNQNEIPPLFESIRDKLYGVDIVEYDTRKNSYGDIVIGLSNLMRNNVMTIATIVYYNPDEKDYIIKQLEKISKTKDLLRDW